jgi:hypothetical protein
LLPIVDHESDHSALCRPVNVGKPHHTRHSIEPSSPAAKAELPTELIFCLSCLMGYNARAVFIECCQNTVNNP